MSLCLSPTVPPTEQITNALDTSVPMERSSWFLTSLLLAGLVNALSAIPMSRFNSNKMFAPPPAPSHQSTTEFSPPSAAPGQRTRAKNDLRIFTAQCSPRGLLTFSSARSYLAECDIMVVYLSVYTV